MWMNAARFGDPFEFGHSYLNIRWRSRIDTWGLFNYHYLSKNLAVVLAALPWLSSVPPYLKLSRHGLALWVTTPALLLVLWPKRGSLTMTGLSVAAAAVAVADLFYQNSGWIQFGYRFSLDYAIALFALLALGSRRFGKSFYALCAGPVAVNLFGAITFDRVPASTIKIPAAERSVSAGLRLRSDLIGRLGERGRGDVPRAMRRLR